MTTTLIISIPFLLSSLVFGQGLFPLVKINTPEIDSLIDLEQKGFNGELDKDYDFVILSFPKANIINQSLGDFGEISYVRRYNPDFGTHIVNGTDVYTTNIGVDTIIIGGVLTLEVNPFQNIYCTKKKIYLHNDSSIFNYIYEGESTYSFYPNGKLKSLATANNKFGSQKVYFDKTGFIIAKGSFIKNLKNGPWTFYSKKGRIIKVENYDNGILIETSSRGRPVRE